MSFGIDSRKLKKLVDLYRPDNQAEQMKYLLLLKGEEDLYINLETCPFQGISLNSIEDRVSAYGPNRLKIPHSTVIDPFLYTLASPHVHFPIVLSLLCVILELVGFGNGQGVKIVILLIIAIVNWVLTSSEKYLFYRRRYAIPHEMEERMVTVIRENNHQSIRSGELVVGDLVVIKEGDIIPADGWLIDGINLSLSEPHFNGNLTVRKAPLKECLTDLKTKLQNGSEGSLIHSSCSPVLIGGSLVHSGEGRMLVLCVGELSRQGTLLHHSQLKFKQNKHLSKLEKLAEKIFKYLFYFNLAFCFTFLGKIIKNVLLTSLDTLNDVSWKNLITVLWTFFVGLPQGLQLGLLVGLWFLKLRVYYADQIWLDHCRDVSKMANVSIVCLDQSFERGRTIYREWWNEQNHHFYKQTLEGADKAIQTEQLQEQSMNWDMDDEFNAFFSKVSKFKQCKQPNQYYLGVDESSSKKSIGGEEVIYTELVQEKEVHYVCQNGTIKFVLANFQKDGQNACLVLGMGDNIIQSCASIISKSTGEINELSEAVATVIIDISNSMNRRLISSFAVGYFVSPSNDLEEQLEGIRSESLTFVCLLGASGIKEHNEYKIANILKQAGISLMLVSTSSLAETAMKARNIGVNALEEQTLALTGQQFMDVIGDIQCSICKKSICVCSDEPGPPRVKNIQQMKHIQKGFRVLGEAQALHKYALLVGLENSDNLVAFLGYGTEDKPALAQSYLSISVGSNLEGCSVDIPHNDIKTVSKLIIWSRFSHQFISRYLQLILPASLAAIALLLIGTLVCQQIVVSVLPLTWVCFIICPLLALGLSWQKPSESLLEQKHPNCLKEPLALSQSMKKQIVGTTIWQVFILVLVMLLGHLMIPESPDAFDSIIGLDWSMKYSDSTQRFVVNGLNSNLLLDTPSYSNVYNTYGIHSRHLTVVFNIYALMQIFNFLNCRKTKDKMINIIEGIEPQTVLIFFAALTIHFVFMILAGQTVGFYPYPLTPSQWLVSIGAAITVWLASFILRLMPQPPVSSSPKVVWMNRSVNLGIKLVGKNKGLAQFDLEEEIQLKIQ